MADIFSLSRFDFPYRYKFPGQATDEQILFITRENKLMLKLRQFMVIGASLAVLVCGLWLASLVANFSQSPAFSSLTIVIRLFSATLAFIFGMIGWWWVTTLWKKSLMFVTNKRLTKFVYTTPASRYSLTLPLEMIVDTGAYTKGFLQTFLKLGTFTARSSATSSGVATDNQDRVNKKYFYIQNVAFSEDLQQYVNKLLSEFRASNYRLDNFRPFLPYLKGDARKQFIAENFPEYSKE